VPCLGFIGAGVYTIPVSLCNLCVLCVSVVKCCLDKINHRDTENAEVAERKRTLEPAIQKNKSVVMLLTQTTAKFLTATNKTTSSQVAVYNGEHHK
jgi:hypothetical protein